ncbi:hypothetical protein DFJ43DRAFT_1159064 [Lentinula guzmanii]|uniref:Pheromone n=1 Tax=Lentinula guzmanii TaxID=2804957 RepID=A0AA38MRJ9_9AGAR|nr:hypothetical protein DFJ43DRAFT_1159064 [Lentinula guzmanii]
MDSFTSLEVIFTTATSSDEDVSRFNDFSHCSALPVNSEEGGGDAIAFCVISSSGLRSVDLLDFNPPYSALRIFV